MKKTNPFAPEPADHLFGLNMPATATFGLVGESVGDDQATVRMPYQVQFANSRGDVHGGTLALLLDCTLAAAVRAPDPAGYGVATIDLGLHYLAPARGDLTAHATCERRGRSVSFARGEVRDAGGQVVALATGSFKLVARTARES